MSRWGTAAHFGVNRTITALGIVARHAGLGLEPFVVRELPACRRTRDVSSCRGGPNGAADSQTAAKLAQGRVGPHARATQRSVGAGGRGTREKVLGSRLLYSPGQPRPSEKIGRASTRGVSKHKPGAFELTHSPRHHITYYSVLRPQIGYTVGYGADSARGILLMNSAAGSRRGVSRAVFKFSVRGFATPRGYLINLERSKVRLVLALIVRGAPPAISCVDESPRRGSSV